MPNVVVLATAGYDHTIRFWEAPTAICCRTLQYPDSQINRMSITRDKMLVAVAGNPHVRLFEVNTKSPNPVSSYDGHKSNVTALGFQCESKWMYTSSEDATLKIWDLRTPNCQRDYKCSSPMNCAQLHPNQTDIIVGDQDGRLSLWDLRSSTRCREHLIDGGDSSIRALSVCPDGKKCAVATNRGVIYIVSLATALESGGFPIAQQFRAHNTYILQLAYSPDSSMLASASADHTVRLWSAIEEYKLGKVLTGHQRWVWDCAFSADSAYLVTGSSDHVARLWDLNRGETIRHYAGHHKAISCVALNDTAT
eukprot:m51a1_g363 putative lst8p (309) ;mRNA; r:599797-600845